MGRVIDALVAYRVLKLLVTPFNRTQAFKMGIIDDKGKVLIKSKDFLKTFSSQELPKARKAYTLLIRFVFNLKRLLAKVGIRGPLSTSAAAAIAFFKEENGENVEIEKTVYKHLRENGFEFEIDEDGDHDESDASIQQDIAKPHRSAGRDGEGMPLQDARRSTSTNISL